MSEPKKIPGWSEAKPDHIFTDAQIVDGIWYNPEYGCDTLGRTIEHYENKVQELKAAITDFCNANSGAVKEWKEYPPIKKLFDIAEEDKK